MQRYAVCLLVWLLLIGCDRQRTTILEPTSSAEIEELSFADQVDQVRLGKSDRIVCQRPVDDQQLKSVRGLRGLKVLRLEQGRITDIGAIDVGTLVDLTELRLRASPLSDQGFVALSNCEAIETVNLPQTACSVEGIKELARLPKLSSLRLGSSLLNGASAGQAIAELRGLRSLHLIDIPLGDAGLVALEALPNLRTLYLDGADVADTVWEHYFKVHPDVHVHVDQAHQDRDPAKH